MTGLIKKYVGDFTYIKSLFPTFLQKKEKVHAHIKIASFIVRQRQPFLFYFVPKHFMQYNSPVTRGTNNYIAGIIVENKTHTNLTNGINRNITKDLN
jgi:hypothetical protein